MPKIAFTETTKRIILDSTLAGNTIAVAANAASISKRTLMNWLREGRSNPDSIYSEFSQQFDIAKATWEANIVNQIQSMGNGKVLLDLLSRRNPSDWGATSRTITVVNDRLTQFVDYVVEELSEHPEFLKLFLNCADNFKTENDLEE